MKTRSQTLMQNMGIYASLFVLILCHVGVWGVVIRKARADQEANRKEEVRLSAMVSQMKQQKDRFEQEVNRTESELREREEELNGYGNFLPSLEKKSETVKQILSLVQELGLSIESQEYQNPTAGTGGAYYSFEFTLKLKGPYQSFKMMLNKIPQTTMIIRIQEFTPTDFGRDNPEFHWQADVKFQTYFSR